MSHTVEQRQYQTHILADEATQSSVEVVPERGGIVTRWCIQTQEVFYMDTERFTDPSLSVRGGIPLLFPICGNLSEDTYTIDGQSYQLKQHGFARTLSWEATAPSLATENSMTVTLRSNEATQISYPFEFELNYIYTLIGNTLELRFQHTNLSHKPMPFATGIHPYFAVTDKSQLTFELPSNQYQLKGDTALHTFAGQFDFSAEEIDFAFTNLTQRSAIIMDHSRSLKLTIDYSEHYSTLVFWTVKGKEFYCLEPWTSSRNALNTGENLLLVEPNSTLETVIRMTVELG